MKKSKKRTPAETLTPFAAACADVAANPVYRWRCSLHEAGHLVVGLVLSPPAKRGLVGAVVLDGGGGLAYAPLGLRSIDEMTMVAAGKAAEKLAERVKPPGPAPRAGALERTVSGTVVADVKADCAAGVLDHVTLARWSIQGVEDHPGQWMKRHSLVHYHAGLLVNEHAIRIVRGADILYATGILLPSESKKLLEHQPGLPAERLKTPPAKPGTTAGTAGKES